MVATKIQIIVSALAPYWLTILACTWTLTYLLLSTSRPADDKFTKTVVEPVFAPVKNEETRDWGSVLFGIVGPLLMAASINILLLTSKAKLPPWRLSWANKVFATVRNFKSEDAKHGRDIMRKNQYAIGQPSFNGMAIWLIVIPAICAYCFYLPYRFETRVTQERADEKSSGSLTGLKVMYASIHAGVIALYPLSFFLIPVTRHSVLLVAMGWNPIHALRLHIWAGYTAFCFVMLHALLMIIYWIWWAPTSVADQIFPRSACWEWGRTEWDKSMAEQEKACEWAWYNFTGAFAGICFLVLWATSLNWVRRRHYQVFYICHVVCGTLMILGAILHFSFIAIYLLPSTVYYLASTAPTLIQALASRFRGGVKISKVVEIQDAGGCLEVQIRTNSQTNTALDREQCMFVKLCVPNLSLVWHPFTVYKHPADSKSVRFLFRPVGPFTKQLAKQLTAKVRPVTLIDGFYRCGDRCAEALRHDQVTIVTGGIAITPFLSMLPSLLSKIIRMNADGTPVMTKEVVLHWACRERGLIDFVVKHYLEDMMDSARVLVESDFVLKINIYFTGKPKEASAMFKSSRTFIQGPDSSSSLEEGSSTHSADCNNKTKYDSVKHKETSTTFSDEVSCNNIKEANVVNPCEVSTSSTNPSVNKIKVQPISTGFAMELARMMPGRYQTILRNLPLAFAFWVPFWLGIFITMNRYTHGKVHNFQELAEGLCVTFLLILIMFGLAYLIEASVLVFRKYLPPERDDYEVVDEAVLAEVTTTSSPNVSLHITGGRPYTEQLFEGARAAAAPGIFMCGPTTLTDAVTYEARKENSYFGLTRFCLYDEPFEM